MYVNFVMFLAIDRDPYYLTHSLCILEVILGKGRYYGKWLGVLGWIKAWWQNCPQFDPLLLGRGPEQACEVSVVNGKDMSQSMTPFMYTTLLTPLVTEICPRRGSTAGGTRLTITGSGFRYCPPTHIHQCVCVSSRMILLSHVQEQCLNLVA